MGSVGANVKWIAKCISIMLKGLVGGNLVAIVDNLLGKYLVSCEFVLRLF